MKCRYCDFFNGEECVCPEVSYEFLDDYDWNFDALPFFCYYFTPTKHIIEVLEVETSNMDKADSITVRMGFVIMKVPIFKDKGNYYCVLQGEKTSKNGNKYYNINFDTPDNKYGRKMQYQLNNELKKALVGIYMYMCGAAEFEDVFDNQYDIVLSEFVVSASELFAGLKRYFAELEEE